MCPLAGAAIYIGVMTFPLILEDTRIKKVLVACVARPALKALVTELSGRGPFSLSSFLIIEILCVSLTALEHSQKKGDQSIYPGTRTGLSGRKI